MAQYTKIVKTYGDGGLHITLSTKEFKVGEKVTLLKETELDELIEQKIDDKLREGGRW